MRHAPLDVRTLLPGDTTWSGELALPKGLEPGTNAVRLALLDPRTHSPAVRLAVVAVEGRASDGWYALSSVLVEPP